MVPSWEVDGQQAVPGYPHLPVVGGRGHVRELPLGASGRGGTHHRLCYNNFLGKTLLGFLLWAIDSSSTCTIYLLEGVAEVLFIAQVIGGWDKSQSRAHHISFLEASLEHFYHCPSKLAGI